MAPKIDPGGAWARKGRPSILNNPPNIFNGFGVGRCPGGAKIHIETVYEHRLYICFLLQNVLQMESKGHQFGYKTASPKINKNHLFLEATDTPTGAKKGRKRKPNCYKNRWESTSGPPGRPRGLLGEPWATPG